MKLIKASLEDLSAIMQIVSEAQALLASLGIDQWQNGYPSKEVIEQDVFNNESYLVKNEDNITIGTAMFTIRPEPTYTHIEGEWITSENAHYGVIHRMAVGEKFRKLGVAQFIFRECELRLTEMDISSMRIDTHQENKGMQALLKKMEYHYCGIIYLANGDKRLAFEKRIYNS